jgi:fatty acid synthase
MVDLSENLWPASSFKMPKYSGAVSNTKEFDHSFFGVTSVMMDRFMDPAGAMLLEHAFEAIIDAGINPKSLSGSNTGVFVGGSLGGSHENDKRRKNTEFKAIIG